MTCIADLVQLEARENLNQILLDRLFFFQSISRMLQSRSAVIAAPPSEEKPVSIPLQRPALPLEVVRSITRLADFVIDAPHLDFFCDKFLRVLSVKWTARRRIWFESAPLTRRTINKLATVQLTTIARHQGWTTHALEGSWSWLELAILKPKNPDASPTSENIHDSGDSTPRSHSAVAALLNGWTEEEPKELGEGEFGPNLADRIKRKQDGTMLVWESHRIPVNAFSDAQYIGKKFIRDEDEIFEHIEEGDSIGVLCCAQRRFWECVGETGSLKFGIFFEPVALV
ncbi:hypothetical protein SCHPADRAFT_924442 [Schizopora paradoxa]|uniref:Uncharacterized protein n=1 Tax=Schizopora paradoxa TaxID=27342 RepID=A0A0H2SR42_9AGAM|nr:hypothetical protein SCHPADRAFT_924442 [Schizopora paradoxa]